MGAAYKRWDGRGWPDELAGEQVPVAARLAQLAEFVEVAHRVGGVQAARELARVSASSSTRRVDLAVAREEELEPHT